jgi:hypothetical protein
MEVVTSYAQLSDDDVSTSPGGDERANIDNWLVREAAETETSPMPPSDVAQSELRQAQYESDERILLYESALLLAQLEDDITE